MVSKNPGFVQNKCYYNYQLNKCVCGGSLGPYITHFNMEFLWKTSVKFQDPDLLVFDSNGGILGCANGKQKFCLRDGSDQAVSLGPNISLSTVYHWGNSI